MTLRRISSGGPYEELVGYSRAVVAGQWVLVAGSTATVDGEVVGVGDVHRQTLVAFGIALTAVREAGLEVADVVRTRMYVRDISQQGEVGRAHQELFGHVRPAATMVEISGLVHPDLLVEVEVDAYRGTGHSPSGAEQRP
ncbi:MAG: RidA family protein [Geodermatophilaceae bacterium]|jgi:enamine deaminase RidA (YjgF/YER057c/UK114 family)|nr:RidA family protein [Geodermatophilaceae bacterium]MDQ3475486.1 RidA family protein [Actinomycetota bacterium]